MLATHADAAGTDNFIFEVYRDAAAYDVHAKSPQFKRYGQVAQQVLTQRAMTELNPKLLISPKRELRLTDDPAPTAVLLQAPMIGDPTTWMARQPLGLTDGAMLRYVATTTDQAQRVVILSLYPDRRAAQKALTAWQGRLNMNTTNFAVRLLTVDTMVCHADVNFETTV